MSDPSDLCNFCFLAPNEQRKLEMLVREMTFARADFDVQVAEGIRNFDVLRGQNRHLAFPKRRSDESREAYEQRMRGAARLQLENTEKMLDQKWENCNIACDFLLNSMDHQKKAASLVLDAFINRPVEGSQMWKLGSAKPAHLQKALEMLHFKLGQFGTEALEPIYTSNTALFDEINQTLGEMKKAQKAFISTMRAMNTEELRSVTNEFLSEAGKINEQIDNLAAALLVGTKKEPDIDKESLALKPVSEIESAAR